jgi:hypothetical protein
MSNLQREYQPEISASSSFFVISLIFFLFFIGAVYFYLNIPLWMFGKSVFRFMILEVVAVQLLVFLL